MVSPAGGRGDDSRRNYLLCRRLFLYGFGGRSCWKKRNEGCAFRSLAGAEDPEGRQLQEAEDFVVQYDGAFGGRVRCIFAPHAIYTCPEAYLRRVISKANRYKCGFWMHIAETKKEVEDCRAEHGTTPVQYLDHLGLFDIPGVKNCRSLCACCSRRFENP